MDPIVFAAPAILAALVAMATLLHWDMCARGIGVRLFGAASAEWRARSLARAVEVLRSL